MSEAPPPAAAPPARRNWMKIALIFSLAFNAVVVGMVVRSMWQFRTAFAMSGAGLEANLPAFIATLAPERREVLRNDGVIARPGVVLRPLRVELRRARVDAARVFLAEPFDKQAFIAAQAKVAEAEANLRRTVQAMLPEIAARMTADERRAFVRWRGPGRGPPGPGGPGGRRGGPPGEDPRDDRPDGNRRP